MIISHLSPPLQRFVALGVALLVALAALLLVILPLLGWTAQTMEDLRSLRERRARLDAIAAHLPTRRVAESFEGRYFAAPDQNQARRQLQARLLASATGAGVATPNLPGAGMTSVPGIVSVRFQASGSAEALLTFVDALEHGQPRIWLAQWKMTGGESGRDAVLEAEARAAWQTQ